MISVYRCNLPTCNTQMLFEDYSNAIYWRIAAIFSTIAALFSVAVVLWFLIFRDNPNLPDETDSLEKSKFFSDIKREKHNLLTEIINTLKNKTKSSRKSNPISLIQKLVYLFFGPLDEDEESICTNFSEGFKYKSKENSKASNNIRSVNEKTESHENKPEESSKEKKLKRFFNAKKSIENSHKEKEKIKKHHNKSKNNNNNNQDFSDNKNSNSNNNRRSYSETLVQRKNSFIKKFFSQKDFKLDPKPLKKNKIELDDKLLLEMNKNFAEVLSANYADAYLSIKYIKDKNYILILFDSILNLCEFDLDQVRVIVDVFYKNKPSKQMHSRLNPIYISSKERKDYNLKFLINLDKNINVNLIKLNIMIIGEVLRGISNQDLSEQNLILVSRSAPKSQILGGAHVKIKDYLDKYSSL